MKAYLLFAIGLAMIFSAVLFANVEAAGLPSGLDLGSARRGLAQDVPSPSVQILSPTNNQIVSLGGVTVTIATQNFTLGGPNRWRLYMDDVLVSTIQDGATSYTVQLTTSGPHTIRVVLADSQHDNLASTQIDVEAAPATPTGEPFNLPWMAPAMAVLAVGIVILLVVALRVGRPPVR